ncbi:MAG: hypothetical protein HY898_27210 [Deltaproteobacteria bacterium]|nr:hypothetical protein [Deltaproteobacteria bacterium]
MTYVGAVNMMVNGRVVTIPVAKVMYQNSSDGLRAGGVVEAADGSLQIILDGRLSEEASGKELESAMEEVSRRVVSKLLN